ncbi:MAG: F0F1 ATP synthase subunit epsilon [Bacteroidales bacterium]|nr:F0F1 ATP synthase subunit epsilon [Bacteroidales bacterium]
MSHNSLILKVLTPDGTAFDGPVDAVFLPGTLGQFEVLPAHAPIISSLGPGSIEWRCGDKLESLPVRDGAVIVENDTVTVCAQVSGK